METAYFVRRPSRMEDLTVLHLVERERPFEVVKTVKCKLRSSTATGAAMNGHGAASTAASICKTLCRERLLT